VWASALLVPVPQAGAFQLVRGLARAPESAGADIGEGEGRPLVPGDGSGPWWRRCGGGASGWWRWCHEEGWSACAGPIPSSSPTCSRLARRSRLVVSAPVADDVGVRLSRGEEVGQ